VEILFHPDADRMYAADASVWIEEEDLSGILCGASRPGHFRGVCTVVAKLFNLVQPDVAVFGEKDAQQLRIIERMVRDLNFPVEIIRGPIVREPDGLAMSSRNRYLSATQRQDALCLRRSLAQAGKLYAAGETDAAAIRQAMLRILEAVPDAGVDYVELVDDTTLKPVARCNHQTLAAVAVRIGSTRLIDNAMLSSR
jgi:pantoate--beta-alanine ligase